MLLVYRCLAGPRRKVRLLVHLCCGGKLGGGRRPRQPHGGRMLVELKVEVEICPDIWELAHRHCLQWLRLHAGVELELCSFGLDAPPAPQAYTAEVMECAALLYRQLA